MVEIGFCLFLILLFLGKLSLFLAVGREGGKRYRIQMIVRWALQSCISILFPCCGVGNRKILDGGFKHRYKIFVSIPFRFLS